MFGSEHVQKSLSRPIKSLVEGILKGVTGMRQEIEFPPYNIEKLTAERTKKGNSVAFKITVGTFFQPPNAKVLHDKS